MPLCISAVSEILYQRTNDLIDQERNPAIIDLACGYSPRVLVMAPRGYTYIGADLPNVAEELKTKRGDLIPPDPTLFAGYRCVDVTDQEQMEGVVGALREKITIVTQGLLTYLTLEQKHELMKGIRSLLERDGGGAGEEVDEERERGARPEGGSVEAGEEGAFVGHGGIHVRWRKPILAEFRGRFHP